MLNLLKSSDKQLLTLNGTDVMVTIKRNARAKRMILRLDPKTEAGVIVTLPKKVPVSSALEMVQRKRDWVISRLANRPSIILFVDDGSLPFRGQEHRIKHHPDRRGTVWLTPGVLNVAGGEEHLSRRLIDWLKKEAKARLTQQTAFFSQQLGRSMGRLTVRDTTSRWGSCSAQGSFSFSWRLILAPDEVLNYVAAHEVAHLKEMNHGPDFWAIVESLYPDYKAQRRWLKEKGPALHRYGKN